MQTDYDNDLQSYFTDMEHLRGMFNDFVSAEKLPKRLIVFHGVGGVGKSSLLRMFRLHCKSEKIPVALASGDDAKSTLDIITRWMDDLKDDGVKFSALHKTLESYRAIQAKVEDQAKKSQNKMADIASKAASKTAEAAGGALLGAAIGSIVPGVGTAIGGMLGSAVGGMGAEALTDWLRGFLDKPSIDLLLDPAKKLTSDFLEDLAKAAEKKRMVLLLDTYEQMSALEDWVGEVAQKIHPNVLMVIAGRKLPDWNRVWSGWMMNAQVEELKPMTEDIMRQLIHCYYATMRGGIPDSKQVDAIVKFARGLPMVVTSAVQLWVKYGVEDFQSVKAEIVANLVDRLMEGVPSNLIPALEAAAIVRWFDQPILRAVLNKEDVRDVFNELRRFPFVRTRVEGLALHDSVREMMDENLRVQDSERHAELHERAAVYFEKRLEKVTGDEAERLGLERLYHRVRADEESGIKLFQEMAEECVRYRLVNRLRALLNDANTYSLERENSNLWRQYYGARLAYLAARWSDAEKVYQAIGENRGADAKLRAYALCDWGIILADWNTLSETNDSQKAIKLLEDSLTIHQLDSKLVSSIWALRSVYAFLADWPKASEYLRKAQQFFEERGDTYGVLLTLDRMKADYAVQGSWHDMFKVHRSALALMPSQLTNSFVRVRLLGRFSSAWIDAGRYSEAECNLRVSLDIAHTIGLIDDGLLGSLGYALNIQGKYGDADNYLAPTIQVADKREGPAAEAFTSAFWGQVLLARGESSKAQAMLQKSIDVHGVWPPVFWLRGRLNDLGKTQEIMQQWNLADATYSRSSKLSKNGCHHSECATLTGLVRVKHAQGDIAAIPPLLTESEQLAQQYEYNDHLASLRLTQGHLAWENGNQDEAFAFYQKAMIYALRYNRFLLDELLSGRPQGTPLHPIIPYCLELGEEGKKILLALCDWWKTGVNDVGAPRPDTISPIPEALPLLEAEKIAREREPGDGSVQKSVIKQIDAMLAAVYK